MPAHIEGERCHVPERRLTVATMREIAIPRARAAGGWVVVNYLLMSGTHFPRRPRLSLTTD
ncbi:MAG: hypothetical protein AB7K36_00085 [Chloroflexota bacterium]